jgi:hypothetical protein
MGSPEIEPAEGITILPTLAFARAGDTLLLCYLRPQGPSDSDWEVWLDRLRIPDFDKLLVSSPVDAGPNSKQRRLVAEYWKASGRSMPRVARLTASPVARGAFTALSWLLSNLPMRAFAPNDLVGALTWLGSSMRPGSASTLLYRFATERSVGTEDNRAAV